MVLVAVKLEQFHYIGRQVVSSVVTSSVVIKAERVDVLTLCPIDFVEH